VLAGGTGALGAYAVGAAVPATVWTAACLVVAGLAGAAGAVAVSAGVVTVGAPTLGALVVVTRVLTMNMITVEVVDVIAVDHRFVAAARAVCVLRMALGGSVFDSRHRGLLARQRSQSPGRWVLLAESQTAMHPVWQKPGYAAVLGEATSRRFGRASRDRVTSDVDGIYGKSAERLSDLQAGTIRVSRSKWR
jgi:GTPase